MIATCVTAVGKLGKENLSVSKAHSVWGDTATAVVLVKVGLAAVSSALPIARGKEVRVNRMAVFTTS